MNRLFNQFDRPKFRPLRLKGLKLWLDASDAFTITSSGGLVSQWNDKSGNGANTTQGTGALQPTTGSIKQNARNLLSFDGGDSISIEGSDILSIPNGDNTIFAVVNSSVDNAVERIVNIGSAANGRYNLSFSATSNTMFFNNGGTNITIGSVTKANANIFVGRRSGTTLAISINNGAEQTNTTAVSNNDSDMATIGSTRATSQFLTGNIAEIIIYNRSLSTIEIKQVNRYLSRKWGVAIS